MLVNTLVFKYKNPAGILTFWSHSSGKHLLPDSKVSYENISEEFPVL